MSGADAGSPGIGSASSGSSGEGADAAPVGDKAGEAAGDLKRRTARGALTSIVGQGASFVLRLGSMVILARLVTPEHFGLVGMVTAITGFLGLFRDVGLSQATIQRATLTEGLTSTLFWVNLGVGLGLAVITAAVAPALAAFYGDPRLFWITVALGAGFAFNGAAAQHRAILQRSMRFGVLVSIDVAALLASIAIGVAMALAGMGYWALVGMATSLPVASLLGVWAVTGWIPGLPRRGTGARSMLHYGGVITLNSLVVYVAYNVDKVLLGRFWGPEVLGVYGRAYQLISIPTENLHATVGWVMFPALSRVQNEPERLRRYFLKGYGLFLSVVMPITVACALFAEDIVRVLLGPQWSAAVPVFRLLAPTILAFAFLNPMAYLMQATGRAIRSLKLAFLIAPVVIAGYVMGLPYGPAGVALGYSAAMLVLVAPAVHWAKSGTLITTADLLRTIFPPFAGTVVGALVAMGAGMLLADVNAFARLTLLTLVLFGAHALTLLFGVGQKESYIEMVRALGVWPIRGNAAGGRR